MVVNLPVTNYTTEWIKIELKSELKVNLLRWNM